ncbi:nitrous oxide reductase accessory protein NosL [Cytobacillus sp. FJAT-53684]|uniref:Nitrous oxide reductase accessory protein NosL n=1 Tax=Cytobacillus mangrovibacter TaxID=3299024 RepID=A0ABW6K079_9BACI
MKFKILISLAIFIILLAGCTSSASGPVEIKQNEDACDACNMGIQELNSAAQMILENGKPLLFDDIGCMIDYIQKKAPTYEAAFVHDYKTKEWIDFDKSTFVQDHSINSPMSYGIAAFEAEENASEFMNEHGGKLYSQKELLNVEMKSLKTGEMEHGH